MNILTERPPTSVKIGASVYDINTDFRVGVEFELMVEAGEENTSKLISPFYFHSLPLDIEGAIDAALWFYRCGNEATTGNGGSNKQSYSFAVDAEAIYSDFSCYYNIDLACSELHWWTFRALLMGLPEDSNFKKRVYYRTCNLKKLPKSERERISKIRNQIEIKTKTKTGGKLSLIERNSKMLEYVAKRSADAQESEVGING